MPTKGDVAAEEFSDIGAGADAVMPDDAKGEEKAEDEEAKAPLGEARTHVHGVLFGYLTATFSTSGSTHFLSNRSFVGA